MAGRRPSQALSNFIGPLQRAVECVSRAVLRHLEDERSGTHSLYVGGGQPRIVLGGQTRYYLDLAQQFKVVEDEAADRGPYRVSTLQYVYELLDENGDRLLGFHWHPQSGASPYPHPHLHVGGGLGGIRRAPLKYHVPTGRVCLEQVLRFAISEMYVRPRRRDWSEILARGQLAHERNRSWP